MANIYIEAFMTLNFFYLCYIASLATEVSFSE